MASITTASLTADIDHALLDFTVTLTTVLPTSSVGVQFTTSSATITQDFLLEENGREVQLDSSYHLNTNGLSTLPSKGWVLNDGTRDLKVANTTTDASGLLMKLDLIARRQR
mgnify:CR=1 FL=1|jgi:hypothetical protein|tara:strand:+ start:1640 stop:1975 length:336 start_codon:yes stop_codon:yes gene_type:complete